MVPLDREARDRTQQGFARLLRPRSGAVLLDGRPIHEQPTRTVARTLGLLPQHPVAPEGVTVAELVGRGRHPHQGLWRRSSAHDAEAVERALAETGTSSLADAPVAELSGGQRQRVWIAMALAQETDLLLLDEPTTYLDLTHQIEMLDLVAALNAERATTVVMVLHDLGLAARYADHLVAMRAGVVAAQGAPADVLTEEMVREVFALDARVIADPESGTPLVVPRCSPHRPSWTASDPRSGRFRHTTGWSPRATGNERVSAWSTGREARKGRTCPPPSRE